MVVRRSDRTYHSSYVDVDQDERGEERYCSLLLLKIFGGAGENATGLLGLLRGPSGAECAAA